MQLGDVQFDNRVFLAPMSGVTDLPFRRLVSEFGSGAVVSEMIASEQLARSEDEALLKLAGEGVRPNIVQLAGREAKWMGIGAKQARDSGADIIDINMGCPAKKVTSGYSGSALMRDLDHALTLIEATVEAIDCPVTLKTRLGWDETSLNAAELIERAANAGVQMVTIHGRTRCQFYKGTANWNAIAALKAGSPIPLIANGDVCSVQDAQTILDLTGADGVMIGRGVYGRPWLIGHAAHFLETGMVLDEPSGDDLVDIITRHYEALLVHYGDHIGLRAARKHLSWYLDAHRLRKSTTPDDERLTMLTSGDPKQVLDRVRTIFSRPVPPLTSRQVDDAA